MEFIFDVCRPEGQTRLTVIRVKVAHVILESAQGPNTSFFLFGGTFIRLGGLGLGPGLDNLHCIAMFSSKE